MLFWSIRERACMVYKIAGLCIALLDAGALLVALNMLLKPKCRPVLSCVTTGVFYTAMLLMLDEMHANVNVKISICILVALALTFLLFSGSKGNKVISCLLYFTITITIQMIALLISVIVIGMENALSTSDSMIWLPILIDAIILLAIIAMKRNYRSIPGNLPTACAVSITILLLVEITQITYLMKDYVDERNDLIRLDAFSIVTSLLIIVAGIAAIFLLRHSIFVAINQRMAKIQIQQYRDMRSSFDAIRRKRHDDKYRLHLALSYIESGDILTLKSYLQDILAESYAKDELLYTDNALIDGILGSKAAFAKQQGIVLDLLIESNVFIPVSDMDFYILFGNALDNAVEANLRGAGMPGDKYIKIVIRQNDGGLYMHISNPVFEKLDEGFRTSKTDAENHGYGLQSINSIIQKYDGQISFSLLNCVFEMKVFLPQKAEAN